MLQRNQKARRVLSALLAAALTLGALVPVAIPAVSALGQAEYEQVTYYHNGASPMDGTPKTVAPTRGNGPAQSETNVEISLDGTWKMTDKGKIADLCAGQGWESAIDATVPGSIYTALMDAGVIPDPYVGDNMRTANDYSGRSWYFRRTFTYSGTGERVSLDFDGLCNVADVYLNGKRIASHEGMFGGPFVDVTDIIKKGENDLVVHLKPAKDFNQTVVFNCSYGWHYAKLFPLGIWQSVTVRDLPAVTLDSPFITTIDHKKGTVDLAIELEAASGAAIDGTLTVAFTPKNFKGTSAYFEVPVNAGAVESTTLRYRCNIPDFRLWWPNGYGEQNLYTMQVTFTAKDGSKSYDESSFGMRTLDYKPYPGGEKQNMYNRQFVINGVDVYMKGAGWCTIDSMMRFDRASYDRFLSLARDAGINYFRAWGGGLVETEEFYDLCDEYGLCVYQEWPCAWDSSRTQPASVLYETVILGAKRLRNRASLVVWGGGNEGNAGYDDEVMNNMGKLTYETDGTRDFWRQDGGTGGGGITHDHIHWSGASPEHYLKTYTNMQNLNMTEYGLSCMMNYESIQKFASAEEIAEWPIDPAGTVAYHTATFNGMLGWTPSPWGYDIDTFKHYASMFVEVDSLKDLIVGSQMAQAQADYLPAIASRIKAPYSTNNVVYKLNDNYPGASWSIIDWYGSPKMAYYMMQDAYRSLMAGPKMERYNTYDAAGNSTAMTVPVYILDDVKALDGQSWTVKVTAYDEGLDIVKTETYSGTGAKGTVAHVGDFVLTAAETDHTPLTLVFDLAVNGNFYNRTYAYCNFEFDAGCLFYLPRTTLSYTVSGNICTVKNTGTKPAVGVQIEVPATSDKTTLGDNYFWLEPGETVEIPVSDGDAVEGVTCYNLAKAADKVAPTPPADLKVTEIGFNSATLTWTPSTDDVALFGYTVTVEGNGRTRELFVRDNKVSVTLEGLAEVTEYTISMVALDNNGNCSETSNTVTCRTYADPTAPALQKADMAADGTFTLVFSTDMNKERAENADHYLINNGVTVTAATLAADGRTVTLKTAGTQTGVVYTVGVVNLTDTKHNENNIGYAVLTVDPGLTLAVDFEPDAVGMSYTSGKHYLPLGTAAGSLSFAANGHSGQAIAAGTSAYVDGMDYTFSEGKSMSLWVYGKGAEGFNVLLAKGPKTTGHFEIYGRSGNLFFYAPDIGDLDMKYNMNTLGDGWHNLVFSWKSGRIVTYADGAEVASISVSGQIAETTAPISFGALNDGSLGYAGAVDTVRLYDRLLSDDEIAAAAKHKGSYIDITGNDVGRKDRTDFHFPNSSTINFWFNPTSFADHFTVLLAKAPKSATDRHYEIYTEAGQLKFYAPSANGGNPIAFMVDMTTYIGSWHMLTLVHKEDRLVLYIDGQQMADVPAAFELEVRNDALTYGQLAEGGMDFKGAIVECELLTEALTADAIKARYEAKIVKSETASAFGFTAPLYTIEVGETVENIFTGDAEITITGTAATLSGTTLTAVAIGESVLYARSADGTQIAGAVVRVVAEGEPDTTTPVESDTLPVEPNTAPVVNTDTTASDGPDTPAMTVPDGTETDKPAKGGCKSAVSLSVLALLAGCAAGLCMTRRKKRTISD